MLEHGRIATWAARSIREFWGLSLWRTYLVDNFSSNGNGYISLTEWIAVTDRLNEMRAASYTDRMQDQAIRVHRTPTDGSGDLRDIYSVRTGASS